jgi:hypothetical protein
MYVLLRTNLLKTHDLRSLLKATSFTSDLTYEQRRTTAICWWTHFELRKCIRRSKCAKFCEAYSTTSLTTLNRFVHRCVRRAWADESSAVLWQSPPPNAFAALPAHRRQHYASMTRRLDIRDAASAAAGAALHSVRFPRLVELVFDGDAVQRGTFAGRCPRLRTLNVVGYSLSPVGRRSCASPLERRHAAVSEPRLPAAGRPR